MAGANTVRIGILKTDAVRDEWVGRFGEYPDMFIDLLGARDPSLQLHGVRQPCRGSIRQHIDDNDAYLITGSRFSVYEDQAVDSSTSRIRP
jgi:hypothetical protein